MFFPPNKRGCLLYNPTTYVYAVESCRFQLLGLLTRLVDLPKPSVFLALRLAQTAGEEGQASPEFRITVPSEMHPPAA